MSTRLAHNPKVETRNGTPSGRPADTCQQLDLGRRRRSTHRQGFETSGSHPAPATKKALGGPTSSRGFLTFGIGTRRPSPKAETPRRMLASLRTHRLLPASRTSVTVDGGVHELGFDTSGSHPAPATKETSEVLHPQ